MAHAAPEAMRGARPGRTPPALPKGGGPPPGAGAWGVGAISKGGATCFAQGELRGRKGPLGPAGFLESAMLVYLKGLGFLPDEKKMGTAR